MRTRLSTSVIFPLEFLMHILAVLIVNLSTVYFIYRLSGNLTTYIHEPRRSMSTRVVRTRAYALNAFYPERLVDVDCSNLWFPTFVLFTTRNVCFPILLGISFILSVSLAGPVEILHSFFLNFCYS